jgi:hypothetical protein
MSGARRQASLFVRGVEAVASVRIDFNPAQAALIEPHVTLIREDETQDWTALGQRIIELAPLSFALDFSSPQRKANFVCCYGSGDGFQGLREALLARPRSHAPHLTLIHPRNGVCTDRIFADVTRRVAAFRYTFEEIAFIEQTAGGPWRTLEVFPLQ